MLKDSRNLKIWNVQKKNLITKDRVSPNLRDVQQDLSNIIGDGYTIYDIISEGGLNKISGKSSGKYICLFQDYEPKVLDTPVTGTVQSYSGTYNWFEIELSDSETDDYYTGMMIEITGGTGSGQKNTVISYHSSTRRIYFSQNFSTGLDGTSQYKIGGYDDFSLSDITSHTDIIITGLKLNSVNQIVSTNNQWNIEMDSGDYTNKLGFKYLDYEFKQGSTFVENLNFIEYCNIEYPNGYNYYKDLIKLNNTSITTNNTLWFYVIDTDLTVDNCYFQKTSTSLHRTIFQVDSSSTSGKGFTIKNSVFYNYQERTSSPYTCLHFVDDTTGSYYGNFQNVLIDKCCYKFNVLSDQGKEVVNYKGTSYSDSVSLNQIIYDTNLEHNDFFNRSYQLDVDEIQDSSNYIEQSVHITTKRKSIRGLQGTIKRMYYQLSFDDYLTVDDDLKYFSDDDLLVIKREDIESVLSSSGTEKKIIDLNLYDNDGSTVYSYRNDENFFIVGENTDDSSDKVIFSFYNGKIKSTVFSNYQINKTYKITDIFQVLQSPSQVTVKNYLNVDDSPITASIEYQDTTTLYTIP